MTKTKSHKINFVTQKSQWVYFRNRYDFSPFLKLWVVLDCFNDAGRSFHNSTQWWMMEVKRTMLATNVIACATVRLPNVAEVMIWKKNLYYNDNNVLFLLCAISPKYLSWAQSAELYERKALFHFTSGHHWNDWSRPWFYVFFRERSMEQNRWNHRF